RIRPPVWRRIPDPAVFHRVDLLLDPARLGVHPGQSAGATTALCIHGVPADHAGDDVPSLAGIEEPRTARVTGADGRADEEVARIDAGDRDGDLHLAELGHRGARRAEPHDAQRFTRDAAVQLSRL